MDTKKEFRDAMRILCEDNKVLSYNVAREKAGRLCAWMTGLDVYAVDSTWSCCAYKYRVFMTKNEVLIGKEFQAVLDKLSEWFGEAEYGWSFNGNKILFLCTKKK